MTQYNTLHVKFSNSQLNPNKAGLVFPGLGGMGGQFDPPRFIFQEELM